MNTRAPQKYDTNKKGLLGKKKYYKRNKHKKKRHRRTSGRFTQILTKNQNQNEKKEKKNGKLSLIYLDNSQQKSTLFFSRFQKCLFFLILSSQWTTSKTHFCTLKKETIEITKKERKQKERKEKEKKKSIINK
ncbi:hypothetical protein RFI_13679 [Reticulomyxa filosa]|uniref:Uncharacterized protein n=1 Tax=Reticulomyxa filosa TaxID=46433 RepID=X6NBW7_RETFI|nr:hypothetical protein RFI_13679 [Reticulomyxa filosa]|eukprot:ETO23501.1 hypothetical protein RFI_13679 [Reticulomyxa filosa]